MATDEDQLGWGHTGVPHNRNLSLRLSASEALADRMKETLTTKGDHLLDPSRSCALLSMTLS